MRSISKDQKRNSSVELFRILSTFLVLIVHFNGWFVGMPADFAGFTIFSTAQTFIEALSCICVNCFLIITGWYGLKIRWKHVYTIWSIIAFIYVTFYFVEAVYLSQFRFTRLFYNLFAIGKESYYVQNYLMLLFLSPILNCFINKFGRKILPYCCVFWSIEIVLDYILNNSCLGFGHGYELTHFILIYLLCQAAHQYKEELYHLLRGHRPLIIILMGVLIIGCEYIIGTPRSFSYTNPVNIVTAFSLFILFERHYFSSELINRIAGSTLAVYIAHCTPPLIGILQKWDNFILNNYSLLNYYVIIAATIFIVFVGGIILDQFRIFILSPFEKPVCNWLNNKTNRYFLNA